MPRTAWTEKDKLRNSLKDFYRWLEPEIKIQGHTQKELAEYLGISPQRFGQKLKNSDFKLFELKQIFKFLDTPDSEILKRMRY